MNSAQTIAKRIGQSVGLVSSRLKMFKIPAHKRGELRSLRAQPRRDECPECGRIKYRESELCKFCCVKGNRNPMKKGHSLAVRKKMSESHKGIKRPSFTKEHRMKISQARVGTISSPTTKEKISKGVRLALLRDPLILERIGEKLRGSLHPNWRGGISKEPYSFEFTINLKEKIRKRDGYVCRLCGMGEKIHIEKTGKVLSVHHITYDKKNYDERLLISLCNWCHTKTNFNREFWAKYFMGILRNSGHSVEVSDGNN
jgi:hypothetical protein